MEKSKINLYNDMKVIFICKYTEGMVKSFKDSFPVKIM